jgi:hypothetical protein
MDGNAGTGTGTGKEKWPVGAKDPQRWRRASPQGHPRVHRGKTCGPAFRVRYSGPFRAIQGPTLHVTLHVTFGDAQKGNLRELRFSASHMCLT